MRVRVVVLFCVCIIAQARVHAVGIMAVADAFLASTTLANQATNVVHFIDTVKNSYETAMNTLEQIQTAKRKAESALKHMQKIGDVDSFSDFKRWHSEQLSMEQAAENSFKGIKVKVGDQSVDIEHIQNLPELVAAYGKANLVDIWGKEPTDEMKMAMWKKLGLTPGNYAYVKVWQSREAEMIKKAKTYEEQMQKNREETDKANQEEMDKIFAEAEDDEQLTNALMKVQARELMSSTQKLNMMVKLLKEANEMKALEMEKAKQAEIKDAMPVGDRLTKKDEMEGLLEE